MNQIFAKYLFFTLKQFCQIFSTQLSPLTLKERLSGKFPTSAESKISASDIHIQKHNWEEIEGRCLEQEVGTYSPRTSMQF